MSVLKRTSTWGAEAAFGGPSRRGSSLFFPNSKATTNADPSNRRSSIAIGSRGGLSNSNNQVKPTPTTVSERKILSEDDSSLWELARSQLNRKTQEELVRTRIEDHHDFLQGIIADVEEKKKTCLANQWSVKWRGESIPVNDVVAHITASIQNFMDIGDQIASYDPAHFGLAWPGVKIALKMTTASQTGMSNALMAIDCVAACLQRCSLYELLYFDTTVDLESRPPLKKALIDLYKAILTLLVEAKRFLGHHTPHRIASTLAKGDKFSSALDEVQKLEGVVKSIASTADAEYMRMVGNSISNVKADLRILLESLPTSLATIERKVDRIAYTTGENRQSLSQINSKSRSMYEILSKEEFARSVQRISSKDVSERYRYLRDSRQTGTSVWLEEVDEVKKIMGLDSGQPRIVWVQGKPGIGKSVQCALIAERIKHTSATPEPAALLEYYFTSGDSEDERSCRSLFRSLLAQLCNRAKELPPELIGQMKDDRPNVRSSGIDLGDDQVVNLVISMLRNINSPIILIDALDECLDPEKAASAICRVVEETKSIGVQVLVTSREHIRPLRKTLERSEYLVTVDADDARATLDVEIRRYTESKLKGAILSGSLIMPLDKALESKIVDVVVRTSEGIILCAQLYLQNLFQATSKNELMDLLENPVVGLRELLVQWVRRTESDQTRRGDLPIQVCMWVLTSRQPLTVAELREAVSIRDRHTSWNEDNFSPPELLLDCCAGILEEDSRGSLRFIHASIREFFTGPSPFGPNEWASRLFLPDGERNSLLAKKLLDYLDFNDFSRGRSSNEEEFKEKLSRYKLLRYATRYWVSHAGSSAGNKDDLWKRFIKLSDEKLESWTQAFYHGPESDLPADPNWLRFDHAYSQIPTIPKEGFQLIISAVLKLYPLFDTLQVKDDQTDPRLSYTCSNGMTALHHAAFWGSNVIIETLVPLYSRENLNKMSNVGWTALNIAAYRCNEPAVEQLLAAGADPSLTKYPIYSPLSNAVTGGSQQIVEKLLQSGAIIDQESGEPSTTPLHVACESDRLDIIDMLLDHGSSFEKFAGDGTTAFHHACMWGNAKVIGRLLSGLSIEQKRKLASETMKTEYMAQTPLALTFTSGDIGTIKTLLEYGADPVQTDRMGDNALAVAIGGARDIEFIRQLLDIPQYRALLFTPPPEEVEMSQLERRLAEPTDRGFDRPFKSILLSDDDPVPEGYDAVDILVWQKPAFFSIVYNSVIDSLELLQLLQKEGANLHELDQIGMNILMSASASGLHRVVEYLLNEVGFEIDATDKFGRTALHHALRCTSRTNSEGQPQVCEILLAHNASMHQTTCYGLAPIHYCESGNIIKMLHDKGADVRLLTEGVPATPAEVAAEKGHVGILQYLHELDPTLVNGTSVGERLPPTVRALLANKNEALEFLLKVTEEFTTDPEAGFDLLHIAIDEDKDIRIVSMIIDAFKVKNRSVDCETKDGRTALHLALEQWNEEVAELLLDNGADPRNVFPSWFDIDDEAVDSQEEDETEELEELEEVGGEIFVEGQQEEDVQTSLPDEPYEPKDGERIPDLSRYRRAGTVDLNFSEPELNNSDIEDEQVADKETQNDANYQQTQANDDGHVGKDRDDIGSEEKPEDSHSDDQHPKLSTLMFAANRGLLDVTKKILTHPYGREIVKYTDSKGRTALHYANDIPIAEVLLSHGADVNAPQENGLTPLHFAASEPTPSIELFRFLISKGADLDAKDEEGDIALDYALGVFPLKDRLQLVGRYVWSAYSWEASPWWDKALTVGIPSAGLAWGGWKVWGMVSRGRRRRRGLL